MNSDEKDVSNVVPTKGDKRKISETDKRLVEPFDTRHQDRISDGIDSRIRSRQSTSTSASLGVGTRTSGPTEKNPSTAQEPYQQTPSVFAPLRDGLSIDCSKPSDTKRHSQYSHLLDSSVLDSVGGPSGDDIVTPDSLPDYCDESSEETDEVILPVSKRPLTDKHTADNDVTSQTSKERSISRSILSHPLRKGVRGDILSKRNTVSTRSIPALTKKSVLPSASVSDSTKDTQFSFTTPSLLLNKSPHDTPRSHPITSIKSCSSTSKSSSFKSYEAMHTIFSFALPSAAPLSGSTAVTVSHHKPVEAHISNVTSSHTKRIVPPQMITKSVASSSLFVSKKIELLREVGSGCDLNVSPDKSEIIITGEEHQVDAIMTRLERELSRFKGTLTSEVFDVEAFYAPLLIEESFVKEIKDEFTSVELTIQTCSGKKLTFDEMSQSLKVRIERRNGKLFMLNDLYNIDLLSQVENNVEKQWFIQDFNGHWDQVPASTNNIFNDQVKSQSTITVKDQGIKYNVNFQEMTVINCHTGFKHPLKNEVVWYYQDSSSGSGFSSYSVNECIQIERCYKTHQCIPVQCSNDRVCLFSFQSHVEIDITNNNSIRRINRQPPISTAFLSPSFSVCVTGVPADIKPAIKKFKHILQTEINTTSIPMPQCCKEVFESHAQQYCFETTIEGGLVSVKGIQQYVALAMLELLKVQDFSRPAVKEVSFNVPIEWERQKDDIEVKILHNKVSKEWFFVETIWKRTMSRPIKKIERIQNKWLWQHYRLCQERLKTINDGRDNEKWLFHGTLRNLPESIYKSDKGFDFRFASPGMWGKGTYFAVNASYSANKYAFKQFMTGDQQVFLARVLTGDSVELPPKRDLTMPPLKDAKDNYSRYDSVKGNTGGSDIYVLYEHDKAYPAYLITF